MADGQLLLVTAASIAFLHTILGPDHYLVFVAMGKARDWTLSKTLRITALCGVGHVLSSIAIGAVGILLGSELTRLVAIESGRGTLAGWALLAFGLVYFAWGLKRIGRGHRHSHVHSHGDIVHSHEHDHSEDHMHAHTAAQEQAGGLSNKPRSTKPRSITPWAMFVIFVLGPCEALIPLFMYPAAQQSSGLVLAVALVFGIVTILTMLGAVAVAMAGLRRLRLPRLERYSHAIAGASIVACGAAINFAGL